MTKLASEGNWPRAHNPGAAEQMKSGAVIVVDSGDGIPDGNFSDDVSVIGARARGHQRKFVWEI